LEECPDHALRLLARVRLQRHKFPAREGGGSSPAIVAQRLRAYPWFWFNYPESMSPSLAAWKATMTKLEVDAAAPWPTEED
jgi:hypothetical protein